jgi:hypothetical protein
LQRVDNGEAFTAQLGKDRFCEMNLQPGERVYVELHNVKVFPEDYSI